jgi:hypothetical protein
MNLAETASGPVPFTVRRSTRADLTLLSATAPWRSEKWKVEDQLAGQLVCRALRAGGLLDIAAELLLLTPRVPHRVLAHHAAAGDQVHQDPISGRNKMKMNHRALAQRDRSWLRKTPHLHERFHDGEIRHLSSASRRRPCLDGSNAAGSPAGKTPGRPTGGLSPQAKPKSNASARCTSCLPATTTGAAGPRS